MTDHLSDWVSWTTIGEAAMGAIADGAILFADPDKASEDGLWVSWAPNAGEQLGAAIERAVGKEYLRVLIGSPGEK